MIELFDAQRLLPRRDRSLQAGAVLAALGAAAVAAHAAVLQHQLNQGQTERQALQVELSRRQAAAPSAVPTPALLADLEREAEVLEAEANGSGARTDESLSAAQWLGRLDVLAGADVSLGKVEIDRSGAVRLEGQARTPQALSAYLQAWDRQQQARAPVHPRSLEVQQDAQAAPLLRFTVRATATAAAAAPQP